MISQLVTGDSFLTSRTSDRKIMQPIRIAGGPAARMRKWNQFS